MSAKTRRATRTSWEHYRQIISSAADAIVTIDERQQIAIFNARAEHIFGYSAAEVIGQPLAMLLPLESRAAHEHAVRSFGAEAPDGRRMAGQRPVFGQRKNGDVFPVEASISGTHVAGKRWFTAVLRDVGERWTAEQEKAVLLSSAQKARDAAEDARSRLAFLAEVSLRLDASLDVESTHATLVDLLVPKLGIFCWLELFDEGKEVRPGEAPPVAHARADFADALHHSSNADRPHGWRRVQNEGSCIVDNLTGESLDVHAQDEAHLQVLRRIAPRCLITVPLRTRGATLGAMTVVRDASMPRFGREDVSLLEDIARRAALALDNAQLYRQAQHAIRQRDETLAIVSHDLRNPLTAISMVVAAMEHPATREEERERFTTMIRRSAHLMRRMIDDLRDVASIEAGRLSMQFTSLDPAGLVRHALQFFDGAAAERSLHLRAEVSESLPLVRADPDRLAQVLLNLVSNAVKFTAPNGEIVVEARAADQEVQFRVRDTGHGIPPDELAFIFDRFWSIRRNASNRSTGLGLAIAKGLVEAHRGRIWAESTPGRGSVFTFTIPAASHEP